MKNPNQYQYIQSIHGETLTVRQWAKRFLGAIAQEHLAGFSKSVGHNFQSEDLEQIERMVLGYARLLTTRKAFEFPTGETPKTQRRNAVF